ncbi:MAG: DUF5317 domain-containing protein [Anaerolineae bacterium]|nr:DUF5317 domain-containing protein [Anaerolineae bacterium]
MILLAAVVLAFLVSLLFGGRPSRLASVSLQWAWLVPVSLIAQAYLIYWPAPRAGGILSSRALVMMVSYVMLLLFLWRNRRLPGVKLIGVGLLANFAVMVANGGYMPITAEMLRQGGYAHLALDEAPGARVRNTKDILLPREKTALWWLSDIFVVPPPAPVTGVFSVGDVLVAMGVFWFLYVHMREGPPGPLT